MTKRIKIISNNAVMKKIYQTPELAVIFLEATLPVAVSLEVGNEPHEGVCVDVKSSGNWDNI